MPTKPSAYPSFLLYVLDQTHITVTAFTALAVLYTRDPHVLYFAIGSLSSSLTAKVIKSLIRSPRPPPPAPPISTSTSTTSTTSTTSNTPSSPAKPPPKSRPRPKKTYGMPSTHSTALTFFLIYLLPLPFSSSSFSSPHSRHIHSSPIGEVLHLTKQLLSHRYVVRSALSSYWVLGIWSRIQLGYHTYAQCFAGAALGAGLAVVWRGGWEVWGGVLGNVLGGLMDWGFGLVGY